MFTLSVKLLIDFGLLIGGILLGVYVYFKYSFQYWKRRKVPYIEPIIPFGTTNPAEMKTKHIIIQLRDQYAQGRAMKAKVLGTYMFARPTAMIIDRDILKRVMIKDFNNFHDRGFPYDEENDPLTAHLLSLEGEKWRNVRHQFSPAFTSGKLKSMYSILMATTQPLSKVVDVSVSRGEPVEMKDIFARYTTDVIASCAYGVEANCLENPDCDFRNYGKKIFQQSAFSQMKNNFIIIFPKVAKALRIRMFPKDMTDFFLNLVNEVKTLRAEKGITRNDIMQNLIELMDKGKMDIDNSIAPGKKMTLNQAAAQAFVFFIGGFDTSSSVMSFAMYELSLNQEVQRKAREDILAVLKRHNNEMSYEALHEMKYLEQVVAEALRKYPSVALATRIAHDDYFVPEVNTTIEKGTIVFLNFYGLHYDPEYFPDPEKFDPDRFSEANKEKLPEFAYLPFGDGPRNCIGKRLGLLQTKVGLATLLSQYKFTLSPKTKTPIKFDPNSANLSVDGGLWLDAEKL